MLVKQDEFSVTHKAEMPFFLVMILFLGITPLLNAGFDHDVIYWLMLLSYPLLLSGVSRIKPIFRMDYKDPDLYLFIFVFWAMLSVFWSINQLRTIIELIQLMSYALMFFLMRSLSQEAKHRVIRIAAITAVCVAMFGILEYIFVAGSRILSTFPNPNPLGTYLSMFFLLLWGVYLNKPGKTIFSAAVIILTALVLSGSRGTYLATALAMPVLLLLTGKKQIGKAIVRTLILFMITSACVGLIMIITPFVQERIVLGTNLFSQLTRIQSLPSSVNGRLEFWKVAISLIKDRPLIGFGHGSYFAAYYLEYNGNEWYSRFTHNHYLQIASELGLIGLSIFVGFITVGGRMIINRVRRRDRSEYLFGAIAASLAFLMHIFIEFSWNFPAVTLIFFTVFGLAVGDRSEHTTSLEKSAHCAVWGRRVLIIILTGMFFITGWQYASLQIINMGLKYSNQGDLKTGLKYYAIGSRLYPISSPVHKLASENYLELYKDSGDENDLAMALSQAEKAVRITPFSESDNRYLASLYVLKNDFDQAIYYYEKAIQYNAFDLGVYADFGAFYLDQARIDDALDVLLRGSDMIESAEKHAGSDEIKTEVYQYASIIDDVISRLYLHQGDTEKANQYAAKTQESKDKLEALDK